MVPALVSVTVADVPDGITLVSNEPSSAVKVCGTVSPLVIVTVPPTLAASGVGAKANPLMFTDGAAETAAGGAVVTEETTVPPEVFLSPPQAARPTAIRGTAIMVVIRNARDMVPPDVGATGRVDPPRRSGWLMWMDG